LAAAKAAPRLRDFFEVDAKFITLATLHELSVDGKVDAKTVEKAAEELGISKDKANPVVS
jgi:pyruvate dehydrogenase E1 component